MPVYSSPDKWISPKWHPDYGDPVAELDRLRSLAIAIQDAIPGVRFILDTTEPGLIEVTVILKNDTSIRLLSVPAANGFGTNRYAMFIYPDSPDEIEIYFDSIEASLLYLSSFGPEEE